MFLFEHMPLSFPWTLPSCIFILLNAFHFFLMHFWIIHLCNFVFEFCTRDIFFTHPPVYLLLGGCAWISDIIHVEARGQFVQVGSLCPVGIGFELRVSGLEASAFLTSWAVCWPSCLYCTLRLSTACEMLIAVLHFVMLSKQGHWLFPFSCFNQLSYYSFSLGSPVTRVWNFSGCATLS